MKRELLGWVLCVSCAAMWVGGCGDSTSDEGSLQSSCVLATLGLERIQADGEECYNLGYSDCYGFASECVGYCAHDVCQPESCLSAADCEVLFGPLPPTSAWDCAEYVVSSRSYGNWCEVVDACPEGTLGCPCLAGTCGPDPFGTGDMVCSVSGTCESTCPSACISGSVCCGGSLCAGDCIGTPCC